MAEYIACRSCESADCKGCNLKRLETMLKNGKFDCLMNENRAINTSADVAQVVHGRWISLTGCENEGVYCSICKKKVWKSDYAWRSKKSRNKLRSNYCPNCGAKMDGDD